MSKFSTRSAIMAVAAAGMAFAAAATDALAQEKPASILPGQSLAGNYLAAKVARTDDDTTAASTFYRSALLKDPENPELQLQAFNAFIANGDFDEGVEIANQLMLAERAPEFARIVLAIDHIRSQEWSSAEQQLDITWRSSLDRLIAGLVRAWARVGEGDADKALAIVDGLEGPDWFDLFVQYHGGLMALQGGDVDEALRRLQIAFDNKAGGQGASLTYLRVVAALAAAHWQHGNAQEAADMLQTGLMLQPQHPLYRAMKKSLDAGDPLMPLVATPQEGAAEVMLNIGTAINKEGGQEFARIYLQLANQLAPEQDSVTIQLADLYDQQQQVARANELFSRIQPSSPHYRIARLEIALNLDELEQLDAAREVFDELIKDDPSDLTAFLSYGEVLARHEKFGEAIPIYKAYADRLDEKQRYHWSLFYRLGIAYERTKQWPLAEAAFKQALELYPDHPSVLNYLGYSWVDMNMNLQEGLDMIRRAVQQRPNDGYMVDSLGWAYYRLGQYEDAVADLERAVSLRPGDPTINDHLGDAYWRTGRRIEAIFQWRHALSLDPPDGGAAEIEKKLVDGLPDDGQDVAKPDAEDDTKG